MGKVTFNGIIWITIKQLSVYKTFVFFKGILRVSFNWIMLQHEQKLSSLGSIFIGISNGGLYEKIMGMAQ